MKKTVSLLVLFLIAGTLAVSAQSYKIIVNEANATASITKQDASNIFLKKKSKWDDGTKIEPIDLAASSATRAAFSEDIHGRGVGAIRSHWQQAAFSGAGTAPLERGNDADVVAFVKSNPGAVGYISAEATADGVKVLTVN